VIRIGEFSRISRVSIKTLRYYDELKILAPAEIDRFSGYRLYQPDQLIEIQEILRFKALGFSLEEIRDLRSEPLSQAEMIDRLRQSEQIVRESIDEQQKQLDLIQQTIQMIQQGEPMSTITVKTIPEVICATMRKTISSYDALFEIVPPMGEIMGRQGAVCAEPAYCFNLYHDGEYRERDIDVEVCEAVVEARADGDGVVYKQIEAVANAVCAIHTGPYRTIGETYGAILSWMEQNGWIAVGLPRESYIDGIWNCESEDKWKTEIQIPGKRK